MRVCVALHEMQMMLKAEDDRPYRPYKYMESVQFLVMEKSTCLQFAYTWK